MSIIPLALVGLGTAAAYVTLAWLLSLVLKNASIIDIFWAPGFAVLTIVYSLLSNDGYSGRQILVLVLVIAWALRLGGHILTRNAGHSEDFRYKKWREAAGGSFWWVSLFRVFYLQGALLWIISAPLLVAVHSDSPDHLTVVDFMGIAVWAVGFLFEAIGDWQLTRFKADPDNAGKVMNIGLWRYTRHPNYFGDATLWWGYFIIAAGTGWGILTIFAPAIMTFMLMRVSGVALLERSIKKRRPGYEEYIARTSSFIPLPPKRAA
jgi:steroid 5-alpha reductase family enzyme